MPHADVNGQRLFYEDSGGSGDPILFSHGFLMDHSMFDPQVEALSDRYRCIRWDERGFGQTVTSPDAFSYWDSAGDALGLLDHLGIERAVLAGMSQGGFLSMRAALTTPERVRALILIDTQPGLEDPEKLAGYDQLIAGWEAQGLTDEVAGVINAILLTGGWDGSARWIEKWRAIDVGLLRQAYTTLTSRDEIWDRLGELTMPTLVVHGSDDTAIELPIAEKYTAMIPGAELAVIDGAGHAANLTHPEQTNPHLERFLAALPD